MTSTQDVTRLTRIVEKLRAFITEEPNSEIIDKVHNKILNGVGISPILDQELVAKPVLTKQQFDQMLKRKREIKCTHCDSSLDPKESIDCPYCDQPYCFGCSGKWPQPKVCFAGSQRKCLDCEQALDSLCDAEYWIDWMNRMQKKRSVLNMPCYVLGKPLCFGSLLHVKERLHATLCPHVMIDVGAGDARFDTNELDQFTTTELLYESKWMYDAEKYWLDVDARLSLFLPLVLVLIVRGYLLFPQT